LFGWQEKVRGKKVKEKIVKGKKVRGKWMESKMIFELFGMSESKWKERGKKDIYLVNDQNTHMFKYMCN
jgi:hypothetical protein